MCPPKVSGLAECLPQPPAKVLPQSGFPLPLCEDLSHSQERSLTLPSVRPRSPFSLACSGFSQHPPCSPILRGTLFSLRYIVTFPSFPFSVLAGGSPAFLSVTENTFNEHTPHSRDL